MHHMSDPMATTSHLYMKCLLIYILQHWSTECIQEVPKSFAMLDYSDHELATHGLLISNSSLSSNPSGHLLSLELQPPQHCSTSTEQHFFSLKGIHHIKL